MFSASTNIVPDQSVLQLNETKQKLLHNELLILSIFLNKLDIELKKMAD